MSKATPLGAVAKFAAAGKTVPRRTSRCRRSPTAASTSPGWPWVRIRNRHCARSARPRPTTGRRWSSPTATASPTASTCETGSTSSTAPSPAATGRWSATTRWSAPRAATRSCSTRRGRDPAGRLRVPRAALPQLAQHRPGRGRTAAQARRGGGRRNAGTSTRRWRRAALSSSPRRPEGELMDLSHRLHGPALRNPLVASASPLSRTVDGVRRLRRRGSRRRRAVLALRGADAAEEIENALVVDAGTESFAESLSYFPAAAGDGGPRHYLSLLERAVGARRRAGDRQPERRHPRRLDRDTRGDAGRRRRGDRAEHLLPPRRSAHLRPRRGAAAPRHPRAVKDAVSVPVAVKLSPYFSSTGEMALRLDEAGRRRARAVQPVPAARDRPREAHRRSDVGLSEPGGGPAAAHLDRDPARASEASLAATTGVGTAADVARYLLAGADVVMTASALLRHGPEYATELLEGFCLDGPETVRDTGGRAGACSRCRLVRMRRRTNEPVTRLLFATPNRGAYEPG